MATLKDLRTQAKARKIKGYSRMNKPQLMSALGVSEKTARPKGDARARSTAQRSGVAKTYAADKLSAKLAGGDAEKAAAVKKEVLKRVSKNLRAAEKVKGDKLTPQEKRAAAAKAIRQVADEQRKASGKNIPLTQGMSPEQREKEKKQFLAQMKRQQTIAQKKADRPNLTAVDGGKSAKKDNDRGLPKHSEKKETASTESKEAKQLKAIDGGGKGKSTKADRRVRKAEMKLDSSLAEGKRITEGMDAAIGRLEKQAEGKGIGKSGSDRNLNAMLDRLKTKDPKGYKIAERIMMGHRDTRNPRVRAMRQEGLSYDDILTSLLAPHAVTNNVVPIGKSKRKPKD
ncbi:hypothetical protein NIES2135_21040 [Leptolyngbya boryana NIES-2135]|uniref:Uncharacterized protein n=1 Tax=Leptolyngbya boryana NIES-2135 TaxID=1973484 RepID=A0A1Z4JEW1_LEPBY|nr:MULTISPECIES: hypothetical protein [Leptolyngbya]BAY55281.1 hypothetical protein NIES2135_21040 [Leptolyngbya boryana NIES-2135]MBD2369365.1 hypothetical protein [Leptolyngbya sp. FACHB-161]MBD2375633.1 hypothetical protein [Leptolyngbya sp. FACHB-238]MBD2401694.1 hypothetical protein [Leptolyngbya sp. FACHB-239]MBD2406567.1 hypothetical protein [Leptolyngbya sp. FACHB-402]